MTGPTVALLGSGLALQALAAATAEDLTAIATGPGLVAALLGLLTWLGKRFLALEVEARKRDRADRQREMREIMEAHSGEVRAVREESHLSSEALSSALREVATGLRDVTDRLDTQASFCRTAGGACRYPAGASER